MTLRDSTGDVLIDACPMADCCGRKVAAGEGSPPVNVYKAWTGLGM